MKIRLSLFCFALAVFASNDAEAQQALSFGDQYGGQPAFQSVSGDLFGGSGGGGGGPAAGGGILGLGGVGSGSAGQPGRFWLQSNVADRGLGYQGTYMTLGAKNRLFEDRFDGRWLMEGQIHHSIEDNGGLFANIGIERIFSVDAANADVSFSAWYDYDGDTQAAFSHDFHQVGASAQVKTPKWDVIGNGYFPVGVQDYALGDPSGVNCFVGNNIVLIPGIDSALEGFDVTWRFRPAPLAIVNGSIDLGGYQYSSGLVNAFGGGRVRLGFQAFRGMIVSAEVNHDDRFNTTGVLGVGWIFGANGSGFGSEYSRLGRDLESVVRNDHIVRFNQDVRLAIDPATGLAYNVIHVNNTADPAGETGTAERPFAALVTAQNQSVAGDIIAVNSGDGTDRNMDAGIILKDNQKLYGTGSPLLLPLQGGTFFSLCADGTGNAPTISNNGGFAVVTLANNNDVAGINIDGTGAQFGIFGNGNRGIIRSNTISNATLDGAFVINPTGNWNFQENTFQNNGREGLLVVNALDTSSTLSFVSNIANNNGQDGIGLVNYDPVSIVFRNNTTNGNSRNGMLLQNYLNSSGNPVLIQDHTATANLGRGIFIDGGDGNLRILDSALTNNIGAGLTVRNWTSTNPTDNVIVGTTTDGTSNISGNGALANVEIFLDTPGARSNVSITNQTLNNGVRGVFARTEGIGTVLNLDILDNVAINNNLNDGIQLLSLNSAILNTHIGSTDPADQQQILGNASGGGDGISLFTQGLNGQPAARINALVENVRINNQFNVVIIAGVPTVISTDGIAIDSLNNSVVDVTVRDSLIGAPNAVVALGNRDTQNGVRINLDNDGSQLINNVNLDNLTLFSNFGVILTTGTQTFTDFNLSNSTIRPNFAQSTAGIRSDNTPFGDGAGINGVFIQTVGQGALTGLFNQTDHPDTDIDFSFFEVITDGNLDNLTRVNIANNSIQDFTLEGIDVSTFGDAQMLLNITGNDVSNNGAGFENDTDNNNVYNDPTLGVADINNLFFFDGVNIDAFDESTISTRIFGNTFRDNFERGLSLNTFNRATINGLVENNVFFGNDRGEDTNNTIPDIGTGVFANTLPLLDSAIFDFEAVNNEEFYIRDYQTPILLDGAGLPIDLLGLPLPANTLGVFYPTNTGVDIFGNPVTQGTARMNLDMSSNSIQLGADLLDFSVAPGDFTLGLDGATNGFIGPFAGITSGGFGLGETLIINEESFFSGLGFTP